MGGAWAGRPRHYRVATTLDYIPVRPIILIFKILD